MAGKGEEKEGVVKCRNDAIKMAQKKLDAWSAIMYSAQSPALMEMGTGHSWVVLYVDGTDTKKRVREHRSRN